MTNKKVEKMTVKELEQEVTKCGRAVRELCAAYLGCSPEDVVIMERRRDDGQRRDDKEDN